MKSDIITLFNADYPTPDYGGIQKEQFFVNVATDHDAIHRSDRVSVSIVLRPRGRRVLVRVLPRE